MFKLAILSVAIVSVAAHLPALNTVQDARLQANSLLRCWEPMDEKNPSAGYALSEPLYTLCSYMPDPKEYEKFYVNGVDESSDDYTNIYKMFTDVAERHAVLNVCLQEGFQFHAETHPSQISLRCLCKRDGCNVPKHLLTFLDYNKKIIPQH